MSIKIWNSIYPIGIDDTSALGMPNLVNNQDNTHVSQIHEPRNAIIVLETIIGSDAYESGSLKYILSNLTFDQIYNNQSGIRTINIDDQPISFYGDQEIRFDGGPIRLTEQGSDPSNLDNYGFVYTKRVDGYSELLYLDNYGNINQITIKGNSIDYSAIHNNVAGEIVAITSVSPVGTDYLLIEDADDSNNKKHILINDIVPLGTKGDIFTYSTTWDNLSIGPDGYLLSVDSSESTGLKWIENISGTDTNAIHKNIVSEISSLAHVSPGPTDYLLIEDADDSDNKKSINVSDIIPPSIKGDIFTYDTTFSKLSIGTDGYLLSADSSESTGLKWIVSGFGFDTNAIHDNVAGEIAAIASVSPAGADYLLIEDADDSNNKKNINVSDFSILTTKGDLFVFGSFYERLPIGTNNYILSANSSEATGLEWIEIESNLPDGYVYLEGQELDLDRIDDYGVVYAKNIEGYGEYLISDLSYVSKFGSYGSGNDQFDNPSGITNDGTYLYICDSGNDRIKKHLMSDLSYDSKFGSYGSGNDQFDNLSGITNDGTYLYICDSGNDRIKKHLMSDLSYNSKIGSYGSGNDQFDNPIGIDNYDGYLTICDSGNNRIKYHLTADLSYYSEFGNYGTGDNQFNGVIGIVNTGVYLYICDINNERIKVHLFSNFSYIDQFKTFGFGNDLNNPFDITYDSNLYISDSYNHRIFECNPFALNLSYVDSYYDSGASERFNFITNDGTYFYISDTTNDEIRKYLLSNYKLISTFGSYGTGNNQFNNPEGITNDGAYLYICDSGNNRIKKHLMSDLSYVSEFGSSGSGEDQFSLPIGITNDGTYLYICDNGNNRVKKHLISDFSYISKNDGMSVVTLYDIAEDGMYLYVADQALTNSKIKRLLASDLSYVDQYDITDPSYILYGLTIVDNVLYAGETDSNIGGTAYVVARELNNLVTIDSISSTNNQDFERPWALTNYGRYLYITMTYNGIENNMIVKYNRYTTFPYWYQTNKDELYYLDDYDGYIQIIDNGVVHSYLGHSEDAFPTDRTAFNEEFNNTTLDSKWSWELFNETDGYNLEIKNNHAIFQVDGNSSSGTDLTKARCLLQNAPVSGDWIAYCKINFISKDYIISAYDYIGMIALRNKPFGDTSLDEFVGVVIYSYGGTSLRLIKKDLGGTSYQQPVTNDEFTSLISNPILCMKYIHSTQSIEYHMAFDSDLNITFDLGYSSMYSLMGYPDKIGLYFKSSSTENKALTVRCEWFRVKLL